MQERLGKCKSSNLWWIFLEFAQDSMLDCPSRCLVGYCEEWAILYVSECERVSEKYLCIFCCAKVLNLRTCCIQTTLFVVCANCKRQRLSVEYACCSLVATEIKQVYSPTHSYSYDQVDILRHFKLTCYIHVVGQNNIPGERYYVYSGE